MFRLSMKRGSRIVEIGFFRRKARAFQISVLLEWDNSWKPIVEKI